MLGSVGLLDVDHHQVGVGMVPDRVLADVGLVAHEGLHHVLVHRLDLDVGEVGEARAQPLRNAEVSLRTPEPDVVVDVVDVGQHRRVARDEVGTVAGEAHDRKIGRQRRDEVGGADLGPAAFEEERRILAAEPGVGRSGRRRAERSCRDAARRVEEHQGVVVHLAVVGGVERRHPDRVFDIVRRRIGAGRGRRRGARERLDRRRRHQHRAEREVAGRLERGGNRRIGREVSLGQREALGPDAAERPERHRVVGDAGRLGRLHHRVVDGDVGAVAARPRRGDHLLALLAQLQPQRHRRRLRRRPERAHADNRRSMPRSR